MSSTAKSLTSKRPLVFLVVGFFNTALDFSFYTFLTSTTFKNGHHIALAGLISGTFAMVCAFLAHGLITWRGSKITHRTALKFLVFTGFGLWVIRPILLSLFVKFSGLYHWAQHLLSHLGINLSYNFIANTGAFGFALVFVLSYNYFIYSRFVFKDAHDKPSKPENSSSNSDL